MDVLPGLAGRVLGDAAGRVEWRTLPPDGQRRYRIEPDGDRVVIAGSDPIASAVGLHDHVRAAAGRRVCWDTSLPLDAAAFAPGPAAARSRSMRAADVYHLNFCTFSYTTAYWDWERWQREIDWMAMHGVTMPLAVVGHEAVLARVYAELGLGDDEIRAFIGGPAYLPFQFMGCLDTWAGPPSAAWLTRREELGARIVERQREYGMTPVLPAFSGHVPGVLAGPGTTTREWWGFPTALLSPHDPRFGSIGARVVGLQAEMFGTSHLYAADPFIEMIPPSGDPDYLTDVATALIGGLRAGDPDAVWVMQAWTFDYLDYWNDERIAAFLDAVPDDAMLILDLWGEHAPQWRRFDGFRGKRWLWCVLHDFGGRNDLFGNVGDVQAECEAAFAAASPPSGLGLAMEATEHNHVVYELALDLAQAPVGDIDAWTRDFARERYGVDDPRAAAAWALLMSSVYQAPADRLVPTAPRGCVTLRPTLALLEPRAAAELADRAVWYDPADLVDALRALLAVADDGPDRFAGELGHDLVTLAATALSRACDRRVLDVVTVWNGASGPSEPLAVVCRRLIDALADLDAVLSMRPELRLSTWVDSAASWATSDDDRAVLVDNARRIVSVWDLPEKAPLTDYSARLWSGLVDGLYRERWRVWTEVLTESLAAGVTPDDSVLAAGLDTVTATFIAGDRPSPDPSTEPPLDRLRRIADACAADLTSNPSTPTEPPSEGPIRP